MTQEEVKHRELVSALADGQLRGDEFARALDCLGAKDDARLTWHAYHLVGDVLRSGEAMVGASDAEFLARLKSGLQRESALAPSAIALEQMDGMAIPPVNDVKGISQKAANESRFHWKMLAAIMSLAVALVLGWQGVSGSGEPGGTPQLAQMPAQLGKPEAGLQAPVEHGESPVMIRDAQLDALLAAHKQFGGTSAFQVPTGFLRNATFEGASR